MDRSDRAFMPDFDEMARIGASQSHPQFEGADDLMEQGLPATDALRQLVATEVIPRLLMTLRAASSARTPTLAHADTLLRLSLSADDVAAAAQLCALRTSGMTTPILMDALVAPVARRLGQLWTDDALHFVEVALATVRLGAGVRRLSGLSNVVSGPWAPSALILTLESERHGLGVMAVAASFREAGWRVREMIGASLGQGAGVAGSGDFDLIGVSVADPRRAVEAARMVASLRKSSVNRHVMIAVGGAACSDDPDFAARIGADFDACTCAEAVSVATASLRRRSALDA